MQNKATYTVTTRLGLAVLGSDPEIRRARVHENVEVARGCAHLDGRDVADILRPGKRKHKNASEPHLHLGESLRVGNKHKLRTQSRARASWP